MVSKRSTRLFLEGEGGHPEEDAAYRPAIRNPKQEDPASSELPEKCQAKDSSRQGSREPLVTLDAPIDVHVQKQVLLSMDDEQANVAIPGEKSPARREDGLSRIADYLNIPLDTPTSSHVESNLPMNGGPANFGVVVPGVYRSSYPVPQDYGFIRNLGLKSIITLAQKDDVDEPLMAFTSNTGIRHYVFNMKGTKKETIPIHTMKAILRLVLNREHHPLLVHCNHGKHRTGCVVGVVRKVTGWELDTIVDEYRAYAEPKVRDCDIKYLTDFNRSELSNLFVHDAHMRFRIRHFVRVILFSVLVIIVWLLSGHRMQNTTRRVKDVR